MTSTRSILLVAAAAACCSAAQQPSQMEAFGRVPLAFEVNKGQTDAQVRYLAHGLGCTSFLTPREAVLAFTGSRTAVLRMKLANARSVEPAGLEQTGAKSNYFIGNEAKKWRTGIATFARVEYKDVYPRIDLVYHGNQRQLEYDFVVAPGGVPSQVPQQLVRAQSEVNDLCPEVLLRLLGREVRFHRPVVY